jgi:hypothetical protein
MSRARAGVTYKDVHLDWKPDLFARLTLAISYNYLNSTLFALELALALELEFLCDQLDPELLNS